MIKQCQMLCLINEILIIITFNFILRTHTITNQIVINNLLLFNKINILFHVSFKLTVRYELHQRIASHFIISS